MVLASWLTLLATVADSRRSSNSSGDPRRRSASVSTPEKPPPPSARGTDTPSSLARSRSLRSLLERQLDLLLGLAGMSLTLSPVSALADGYRGRSSRPPPSPAQRPASSGTCRSAALAAVQAARWARKHPLSV